MFSFLHYVKLQQFCVVGRSSLPHDVLWFVENKSLMIGGIDIFNFTNEEIPTHQIEEVFGYNEWVQV
jgi:hypothetical protein